MPPKKKQNKEVEIEKVDIIESETKEDEDIYSIFAELIEMRLENKNPEFDLVNITNHTEISIDGIPVSIFVEKKDGLYNYQICSIIIYLDGDDDDDVDDEVILYEKHDFDTLLNLQKDIHEVKKTHRLLEHRLLSPIEFEFAKIQRKCFPLSSDKSCCVCYELTMEYTICNHSICYRCREKCVFNKNFTCPICREENLNDFPEQLTMRDCVYHYNE
jgi:hypothetical protein